MHENREFSDTNKQVQVYYDQSDTHNFYQKVSGGEHVHIGLFQHPNEDLEVAKKRTTEYMTSLLNIDDKCRILDLGAGYGGTARYLAKTYSSRVSCLNISKMQNAINLQRNQEQELTSFIDVQEGTFEQLPYSNSSFDVIWSQDAIYHSTTPEKVFQECSRVLGDEGELIFSVVMLDDSISTENQQKLTQYYSLNLQYLQTYRHLAEEMNFCESKIVDFSENIQINYSRLLEKMEVLQAENNQLWSLDFYTKMKQRLLDWVDAGEKGLIHWKILHFQK
ncbi:methyltransferase domain-containing protein [Lyngbya sp. CCAP 1446/10]|uniref:SAM-dependent methyltransferase n=1 Tax=Lyngbya sp. CCAP 1446/10 TaxID=439293 RepID=UPI002238F147|nr:class I SAM-dependent methyltransferase [Lyngbya sp. CCAP 1446/10]MCW6053102.1 methyltransferase domain-containing protein [Lyngbya sp. CCAP 1446/10]